MATILEELLGQLSAERRAFVDALDSLPREICTSKPSTDAWSPLEIAEHVFKTERSMLRGVSKQLDPESERRTLGKPSRTMFIALIVALRSPVKFKVPSKATAVAPGTMTYEEIRADWLGFEEQWRTIAESIPNDLALIGLVRHPVIGPMTLNQCLHFLVAHSARHFKQLERTVGSPRG